MKNWQAGCLVILCSLIMAAIGNYGKIDGWHFVSILFGILGAILAILPNKKEGEECEEK